jgi:hypothetical protein
MWRWLWGITAAAALVAAAAAIGWWTMFHMPGESFRGQLPAADDALRALAAELHRDVGRLAVEVGERNVSNRPKELAEAAGRIAAELAKAGYEVKRQEYEVSGVLCANLEVEILGTSRPGEVVVVGAHYDTVHGSPGADDNTSGVAGVLALARHFSKQKTGRTLRLVAFVNEEPPYFQTGQMGSRVYARRCKERGEQIVAMLSLEMLGYYDDAPGSQKYPPPFSLLYPSEGNFVGFVGNLASGPLVRQVIGAFRRHEQFPSEGAALPEFIPGVNFSDQWSFWQEDYPAIMVTDTAMYRNPHYHTPQDTIEKIDFQRAARVVRGLAKAVEELTTRPP